MRQFGRRDLQGVLDLLGEVTRAENRDEFFRSVLEGLSGLFPCLVATINELDPPAGRARVWVHPEDYPLAEDSIARFSTLMSEHPVISYAAESGDGSAYRISDFWSTEQLHASELYRQVYGELGVEFQIAITLPAPLPTVLGIVLNRHDRDFTDYERDLLNYVRPHLAQAWRNVRDQARLQGLIEMANTAAYGQGRGVILLLDPPVELTPGALGTLIEWFGEPLGGATLPARVEEWIAEQRACDAGATLDIREPLSDQSGGRRIVVQYLPSRSTHPGGLVVREDDLDSLSSALASLGLRTREAEVVRLVIQGESNPAIARRLNMAPGTVKKHLDNVYNKLGARSRGALTALVLDLGSH